MTVRSLFLVSALAAVVFTNTAQAADIAGGKKLAQSF